MPQIDIRRARPEDLDAIAGLHVELKRHHRPLQPDNPRYRVPDERWLEVARQNLANDAVHLFVAATEGLGVAHPAKRGLVMTKKLRRRYWSLPGRMTRSGRKKER